MPTKIVKKSKAIPHPTSDELVMVVPLSEYSKLQTKLEDIERYNAQLLDENKQIKLDRTRLEEDLSTKDLELADLLARKNRQAVELTDLRANIEDLVESFDILRSRAVNLLETKLAERDLTPEEKAEQKTWVAKVKAQKSWIFSGKQY